MARIFETPAPASLAWADVESLFATVGCTTVEGAGSRVRFAYGTEIAAFHRPHPEKEAKRYQVREARDFLERIGVKP